MSVKLWEMSNELEMLGQEIADCGGEITELMEQRLEALEGDFEHKVESIALYIREHLANAEAAKIEEQRLSAIRKMHESTATSLKRYLQGCLDRVGFTKVNTPKVRVRIQRNSQPSCVFTGDMENLPHQFLRIKVDVDTKKVMEEWEQSAADVVFRVAPEGFDIRFGNHIRIS